MTQIPPLEVITPLKTWNYLIGRNSGAFADAIQQLTGWQLVGIQLNLQSSNDSTEPSMFHIGIRTPSGLFLDSRGLQTKTEFLSLASSEDTTSKLIYLTRAEMLGLSLTGTEEIEVTPTQLIDDASSIFDWALEQDAGVPQKPQPFDTVPLPNGATVTLDENGYISGEASVSLEEIVGTNLEGFLDTISLRISGSELLMDLSYEPARIQDGVIILKVSGDPSEIFECLYGPYGEGDVYQSSM